MLHAAKKALCTCASCCHQIFTCFMLSPYYHVYHMLPFLHVIQCVLVFKALKFMLPPILMITGNLRIQIFFLPLISQSIQSKPITNEKKFKMQNDNCFSFQWGKKLMQNDRLFEKYIPLSYWCWKTKEVEGQWIRTSEAGHGPMHPKQTACHQECWPEPGIC